MLHLRVNICCSLCRTTHVGASIFKDEFWAGMRSTQRSENMHAVFDKYLNLHIAIYLLVPKMSHRQGAKGAWFLCCWFKENYLLGFQLRNREEVSKKKYTNSIFQDVQDQFIKKADCILSSVNHHDTSTVCEVNQQKMVCDMSVYSRYQVVYCSIS